MIGDDQLPPAWIEGCERGLDGDLNLPGRGRRRSGGRVDRAMANQEQVPPGATPVAIRCIISSTDPAMWTYRQTTRAYSSGWGVQAARSASIQAMRSATSGPKASAVDRANARAVAAKSTAVTCHPRAASHSVSDPWPQPASRARPGRRSPTSAVRCAFGGRCATRSPCSRRACHQRSSQKFRSYSLKFGRRRCLSSRSCVFGLGVPTGLPRHRRAVTAVAALAMLFG